MKNPFRKNQQQPAGGGPRPQGRYLIAVPALDGKIDMLTVGGVLQALSWGGGAVQFTVRAGDSDIRHCRNAIAHNFLTDPRFQVFDQLICIDADIGFSLQDFQYLLEGPEDLVVAPYARKVVGRSPVDFGMGFVRIHRRVFKALEDWTVEGEAALRQYTLEGALATDFFVNGPLVGTRWFGEDTGFFHLCANCGVRPRLEQRTRLIHVGRFHFGYPDQTPGLIPLESAAQ